MPKFTTQKHWIFTEGNTEGRRDLSPIEVIKTYEWVKKKVFPLFNLSPGDATPLGSYGKKTTDQVSSDIDVAVSIMAITRGIYLNCTVLDFVNDVLERKGFNTKRVPGFNQVSFGVPIQGSHRKGLGQVDFMLSKSLKWSKFMYHSPDYTKHESQYKGVVRTILMMAVLSESTRNILSSDDDGNTIEVESKVLRMPEGIFSTRRSFMGKRSLIKKAKLMKEFDMMITNDPDEAAALILGKEYGPSDLNSFETIWKIINGPDFIHRKHLGLIVDKFMLGLKINGLPVPVELGNLTKI